MVWNEGVEREIPEGWEVKKLKKLLQLKQEVISQRSFQWKN
jgi:hypothetical protein